MPRIRRRDLYPAPRARSDSPWYKERSTTVDAAIGRLPRPVRSGARARSFLRSQGLSYDLKGEIENAARYLERASGIRPASTSLLNALGGIYLRLGRPDDARRVLEQSLALDPRMRPSGNGSRRSPAPSDGENLESGALELYPGCTS